MDKKKGYQNLTEEEEKIWIPNRNLQLTQKAEIVRLNKVIEEKNAAISKFKKYDEERSEYCHRLEQNYALMEERFGEFADAIGECDDIEDGTKEFYKEVINSLYKGKISTDMEKSVLQQTLPKLEKMQENLNDLECCIMGVGNAQRRGDLLNEYRKVNERYSNILKWFKNKIKELK